jgi:RimJ/RimL family protein N-acetyltransferase
MNPFWIVRTGRLVMRPVSAADLPALKALKADPRVFAVMLGGVRTPQRTVEELAEEIALWGRLGVGIWAVRHRVSGVFLGIAGFVERPDGRGISLRFAFVAAAHGQGFASEAAGAALRFAHERARLPRVVAVARADNLASREVLGAIGMHECGAFERAGVPMLVFESVRTG